MNNNIAPMQSAADIWATVLEQLREKVSQTVYNLWLVPLKVARFDGSSFILTIASDMRKNVIERQYYKIISEALQDTLGFEVNLYVLSTENGEPDLSIFPDEIGPGEPIRPETLTETYSAPPVYAKAEFTFENFIIGESNKFAQAASFGVASHPMEQFNPLFIYGGSGLGKTHLLYAIMNYIQQHDPSLKILYVKGEEFTNELVDSIRQKTQSQFRQKYRKVDVLLIDDIQFIAGKEGIQDEFFHTFNALYEEQKQIILAADRPPRDMAQLEQRLKTRFEWGMLADVQPPDYELRVAIIKNKLQSLGVNVPREVVTYLAENLRSNIRQLEGAVKKICAQSFISGDPVTLTMARAATAEFVDMAESDPAKAERIIEKVSKKYGVSVEDIKGRKRVAEIANARHICIYLIRKQTELATPSIGQIFDRDHTTIISSIAAVEKRIKESPMFELEINDLLKG